VETLIMQLCSSITQAMSGLTLKVLVNNIIINLQVLLKCIVKECYNKEH